MKPETRILYGLAALGFLVLAQCHRLPFGFCCMCLGGYIYTFLRAMKQ
jgi:hypothetical protein